MRDEGATIRLLEALNHNCLHSLRFQAKRGGLFDGEVQKNMRVFDERCRELSEMKRTTNLQNLQNLQMQEMWVKPDCGSG